MSTSSFFCEHTFIEKLKHIDAAHIQHVIIENGRNRCRFGC